MEYFIESKNNVKKKFVVLCANRKGPNRCHKYSTSAGAKSKSQQSIALTSSCPGFCCFSALHTKNWDERTRRLKARDKLCDGGLFLANSYIDAVQLFLLILSIIKSLLVDDSVNSHSSFPAKVLDWFFCLNLLFSTAVTRSHTKTTLLALSTIPYLFKFRQWFPTLEYVWVHKYFDIIVVSDMQKKHLKKTNHRYSHPL